MVKRITVPAGQAAKSLENYLKRQFPIGFVRKLFRKHGVRINGQRSKPEELVHSGDEIQLYIPFENWPIKDSRSLTIPILYENRALLVINKPAGLAVHEGRSVTRKESLWPWMVQRSKESGARLELVHRLDKDTSGAMVIAKSPAVTHELEALFATRNVKKKYLCLVIGFLARREGTLDSPLPGRANQMVPAQTHYSQVEKFSDTTLLNASITTGRLHQIRLHFSQLGHPVVMDAQHGDFRFNKNFRNEYGLKRQFLHAERVYFTFRGERIDVKAPIPDDLQNTLTKLRQRRL